MIRTLRDALTPYEFDADVCGAGRKVLKLTVDQALEVLSPLVRQWINEAIEEAKEGERQRRDPLKRVLHQVTEVLRQVDLPPKTGFRDVVEDVQWLVNQHGSAKRGE